MNELYPIIRRKRRPLLEVEPVKAEPKVELPKTLPQAQKSDAKDAASRKER